MQHCNSKYNLKAAITAVFLIITGFVGISAELRTAPECPDFAFPREVEQKAEVTLHENLKAKKYNGVLRDILNLTVAKNITNREKVIDFLTEIDSIVSLMPSPYSALGHLLEAEIYCDVYSSRRSAYDTRSIEKNASKENNPQFWNLETFKETADSLISLALSERTVAVNTPLSSVSDIVSGVDNLEEYTVYDFIVYKSIQLNSTFPKNLNIIPFFKNDDSDSLNPLELIGDLLKIHSVPGVSRNTALLQYAGRLNEDESRTFLWNAILEQQEYDCVVPLATYYFSRFIGSSTQRDDSNRPSDSFSDFFNLINRLRRSFKTGTTGEEIERIYNQLIFPSVVISYPSLVTPGKEFEISADACNLNKFYILVLKDNSETDEDNFFDTKSLKALTQVKSTFVECSDTIPFVRSSFIMESIDKPGKYVIVASLSSNVSGIILPDKEGRLPYIKCSDIDLITLNPHHDSSKDVAGCFVVDANNCAPLENATVEFKPYSWDKKAGFRSYSELTDQNGFATSPIQSGTVKAKFNNSTAVSDFYSSLFEYKSRINVGLFPSQSVYRPGDTIQFAGVAFENEINKAYILKDQPLKIRLRDANYKDVFSKDFTTDETGRFFGSIPIPEDGLLGVWRMECSVSDISSGNLGKEETQVCSCIIRVEEYKFPSFIVTLAKQSAPSDSISFAGCARTYSGMAVFPAHVTYTVNYRDFPFWRRGSFGEQTFTSTACTDENGNFIITLPINNLNKEEYRGRFSIKATVTNEASESVESSSLGFCISERYSVNPSVPSLVNITKNELSIEAPVYDSMGLPAVKSVEYKIVNAAGETVREGFFDSPLLQLKNLVVPSGRYRFSFRLDSAGYDWETATAILYSDHDRIPPVDTVLWCPEREIIVPYGAPNAEITFGSSVPGQHILFISDSSDGEHEFQWIVSKGDNSVKTVKSPAPGTRKYIRLITFSNHKFYQNQVTLIPEAQTEKLTVTTETFRPAINACDFETWKFRIEYGGKPVNALATALLYDKAMDAVSPLEWPATLFTPSYPDRLHVSGSSWYRLDREFHPSRPRYPVFAGIPSFDFQTCGYPLYTSPVMLYQMKNAAMATRNMAAKSEAIEETAADDSAAGAVTNESVPGDGESRDEQIRPVELPVAFFKPGLCTDENGELNISFVTPNFNTTWNLIIEAFTEEMASAQLRLQTVASKKIMIRLQSPRFLRTGDSVELKATVYNNSSDTVSYSGEIEFFNPSTGEILGSGKYVDIMLAPSRSGIISCDFQCPDTLSSVGVRGICRTSGYSDGEEVIIPVLPSSQPVVESWPFFIAPGQKDFNLSIPALNEDASVTFTYCDNPAWEVLTALSPLASEDSKSFFPLMSGFWTYCMGTGIIRNNPSIREGMDFLINHNGDETLQKGRLNRNEQLKIAGLNNTPWVNNAENETERLSSLKGLLNDEQADKEILSSWNRLLELRNSDGSFSWLPGSPSSRWITEHFLLHIALLKNCKYLPPYCSDSDAIREAISYCDNDIMSRYKQLKPSQTDSYLSGLWKYLFIRSFYTELPLNSKLSSIKEKSLNLLVKDWRNADVYKKAILAILLWREKHQDVSKEILESIRSFATEDSMGAHFANMSLYSGNQSELAATSMVIMAFNEIMPGDPIIDKFRQWLIIQKQSNEWSKPQEAVFAADAVLNCGTPWNGKAEMPIIEIGGSPVPVSKISSLTGSVTIDINPVRDSDKTIIIRRQSSSQAWGGIVSQAIKPIETIENFQTPQLSVRKEIVNLTSDCPESVAESFRVNAGDKVRINLLIQSDLDLEYVVINDERAACLEPTAKTSGYTWIDGLSVYLEIRTYSTNLFIGRLPKGKYVVSYDCFVTEEGDFASGVATIQSLYNPLQTAHSAGMIYEAVQN